MKLSNSNLPVFLVALVAGVFSVLATLLGLGYLEQKKLRQEAAEAASQAEAAATTARQAANKGERAREQAQDLVGFIMQDLHDELIPIGQAGLLEDLSKQALKYFETLPPDLITRETREQHSSVLTSLGHAHYQLGDFDRSISAHRESIGLLEKISETDPENQKLKNRLGHLRNELGIVLISAKEIEEATSLYLQVLENQSEPGNLAAANFGLGRVESRRRNYEASLNYYKRATQLSSTALAKDPEDMFLHRTLMTSNNNAGLVAQKLNQLEEAENYYLAGLDATRKVVQLEPDNRHWQKELATLLNNLGTLLDDREEFARAEEFFNEALELRRSLVSWDPNNTRWLLNLANSWHNDAGVHFHRKNPKAVLDSSQEMIKVFQKLVILEPDNTAWLDQMLKSLETQTTRLNKLGAEDLVEVLSKDSAGFLTMLQAENKSLIDLAPDLGQFTQTSPPEQSILAAETYASKIGNDASRQQELILLIQTYINFAQNHPEPKKMQSIFALAEVLLIDLVPEKDEHAESLADLASRGRLLSNPDLIKLLPAGSDWKYRDLREPPPASWIQPDFDDSSWSEGPAPLGYGDGDEKTRIKYGSDSRNKRITSWFRHEFELESTFDFWLNLQRDDGAIVFLNGEEIVRDGLPPGPISHETVANHTAKALDEKAYHTFQFTSEKLRKGKNVIAVEIHQNEAISSDLSFDLEIWSASSIPPLTKPSLAEVEPLLGEKAIPELVRNYLSNEIE